MKTKKTITDNTVDPDILRYTVGDDVVLDSAVQRMITTDHYMVPRGLNHILRYNMQLTNHSL